MATEFLFKTGVLDFSRGENTGVTMIFAHFSVEIRSSSLEIGLEFININPKLLEDTIVVAEINGNM
jgi:hypothetical protein